MREGISLGNLGGDFAIVGNEPVVSNGTGEAYGMEFWFSAEAAEVCME